MMSRARKSSALAGALLTICVSGASFADGDTIKKTLDGRCLAPDHKDYWETKVYVAKPSMEACIKSGGKPAK
ncbi:MAG: hypothetical protein ACR2PZ_09275 [Pseudomonadales bacterium]